MDGIYRVVVGDRGRLVVPAELRKKSMLQPGTSLMVLDTPSGLLLLTREQLKKLVRKDLRDLDLVGELLAERRRTALAEEAS